MFETPAKSLVTLLLLLLYLTHYPVSSLPLEVDRLGYLDLNNSEDINDDEGAAQLLLLPILVTSAPPGTSREPLKVTTSFSNEPSNTVIEDSADQVHSSDNFNDVDPMLVQDCLWHPVSVPMETLTAPANNINETTSFVVPILSDYKEHKPFKIDKTFKSLDTAEPLDAVEVIQNRAIRSWTNGQGPGPALVTNILQILVGGQGPWNTSIPAGLLSHGVVGAVPLIIHGIIANPGVLVNTDKGPGGLNRSGTLQPGSLRWAPLSYVYLQR